MFSTLSNDSSGDLPRSDSSVEPPAEVLERARAEDSTAFAALFQQYNAQICTYLARLVGNDDAGRDLAQETFIRAWKSLPQVHGELHFKPWLYRIATNTAKSHLRHERLIRWLPWQEHPGDTAIERLSITGPEEHAGEAECVRQALAQLSPQCRTCLLLQLVAGFSQREIAQSLRISEKSVSAYVSRGREQFRQVYRRMKGAAE